MFEHEFKETFKRILHEKRDELILQQLNGNPRSHLVQKIDDLLEIFD